MAFYTALGNSGADEEPTLLWTNPKPTNSFAAQTVALDLSPYKSIAILYNATTTSSSFSGKMSIAFYKMGDAITIPASSGTLSGYPTVIASGVGKVSNLMAIARDVTITTTGVEFGLGSLGTGSNKSSGYAIPQKIYGIKAQIYPSST